VFGFKVMGLSRAVRLTVGQRAPTRVSPTRVRPSASSRIHRHHQSHFLARHHVLAIPYAVHTPSATQMSLKISRCASPSTGATKAVTALLAHFQPKLFRLNYSPNYTTFIKHFIAHDAQHPLNIQRKREYENRKREGLWWHITSTVDLSKSSVVRNSCRKRLRKAFVDALRERGFDERGKLVEFEALEKHLGSLGGWMRGGEDVHIALTGSLRFHVAGPLITAKYKEVKEESGMVIEALLEGVKKEVAPSRRAPTSADAVRSQWNPPPRIRKSPASPNRSHPPIHRVHFIPSSSRTRQQPQQQRRAVNLDT
jgi:hypothetical protein